MVTRRFHTITLVSVEIIEPSAMMGSELESENMLEEEFEIAPTHRPVDITYDVVRDLQRPSPHSLRFRIVR